MSTTKSTSCRICHRCLDPHLMFGDLCVDHQQRGKRRKLPPDPDRGNLRRSKHAEAAFSAHRDDTNCYDESAMDNLTDMLCNLAHFCDRKKLSLPDALRRAADHYQTETASQGTQL